MDKEIIDNLTKIGLGKNESEVYLSLLELGESKAGPLSNKSGIPTSHIYSILEELFANGLIAHKFANNVKIYYANPPEALKTLYIQKQKELDSQKTLLLASIEAIKKIPEQKDTFSDYKYFEGTSGIIAMWQEIISNLIPNTAMEVLAGNESAVESFNDIFMNFQKERVRHKIKQKIILPKSLDKKYTTERKKLGLIEFKYTELESEAEICIFDDSLVIEYLGTEKEKPRAFLIKDKLFVTYFRLIFNMIWKISSDKLN